MTIAQCEAPGSLAEIFAPNCESYSTFEQIRQSWASVRGKPARPSIPRRKRAHPHPGSLEVGGPLGPDVYSS